MATTVNHQQQIVAIEAEMADLRQKVRELEPVANAAPDNQDLQERLTAREKRLADLQL